MEDPKTVSKFVRDFQRALEDLKNDVPMKTTIYKTIGDKVVRKTGVMKPSEVRKARKRKWS